MRGPASHLRAWGVAAGVVAALSACGESSTGQSLASLVLNQTPQGFHSQSVGDNGTLSIDDASAATPADPTTVRQYLNSSSWRGAYARVWVSGSDYVEDLGYTFASSDGAAGLVKLETTTLQAGQGNYVYPFTAIPGAQGFVLYSQTRVGGHDVFCNGIWFAHSTDAFEILTCGATPGDDSRASQLADQQFQAVGGTPATPTAY